MTDATSSPSRTRTRVTVPVEELPEAVHPVAPRVLPQDDPESEIFGIAKQVAKMYGDDVVTSARTIPAFKHIPFGILPLDFALGGGIPEGLCTMIFGWASGGKTTITLRAIAGAQVKHPDKVCIFVDAEGTFDPEWAQMHGVDLDRLLVIHPSSGEQAADLTCSYLQAKEVALVALDSLPALVPMKELDKSMEDATVGGSSQLIGRFLRKANHTMTEARKRGLWPTLILINQWRYKIGVMHGDPRVLPGGQAINYVASIKLEVMNKEKSGASEGDTGAVVKINEHAFRIHKNKIINGARDGEFQMIRDPGNPLGEGFIDDGKSTVNLCKRLGLVTGGGQAWRCQGVDETFRKLDDMVDYFYMNADVYERVKRELISEQRAQMGKNRDWY
jgi:recombination protein RecA